MPNTYGTREHRFTPAERRTILARDGYACQLQYRGCLGAATIVDHIVPLALGGTKGENLSNGAACCEPCHTAKTNAHRAEAEAAEAGQASGRVVTHPPRGL